MIPKQFKYKICGRFKGRKKINDSLVQKYKDYQIDFTKDIQIDNKNILDIGSGSGENSIFLSLKHPKADIIACDLYEDGNFNLIDKILKNNLNNIHFFKGNIIEFLDLIKPSQLFDEIWILFPDPWPKKRHHKRRLISDHFLKKIHHFIKDGGKIMIATDSSSYTQSILSVIHNLRIMYLWENPRFLEWNYDYLNLARTKFYQKAKKSFRKSIFFILKKI